MTQSLPVHAVLIDRAGTIDKPQYNSPWIIFPHD